MNNFRPGVSETTHLYRYLTAPASELPAQAEVGVIFGRKSAPLAELTGLIIARSKISVISGEVGKDSGDNPLRGIREDDWLVEQATAQGVDTSRVFKDPHHPQNGIDNARNMVHIICEEAGLTKVETLVAGIHATQVRRLGATLMRQTEVAGLPVGNMTFVTSGYRFDAESPFDQYEAAFEAVRMDQLSTGADTAFDRPEGLDAFLPHAYATLDYLDVWLADQGIKNWSTADGTLRDVAPGDLPALFEAAHKSEA